MIRNSLVVMVFVAACGGDKQPSLEGAIKTWSPKVDAKLAKIEGIVRGLDKVEGSKVYTGSPRAVVEELQGKIDGDTLIAYRGDLTALVADKPPATDYDRHTSSKEIVGCWYIMRKQQYGSFRLTSDSAYAEFRAEPGRGFQVQLLCNHLDKATHLAVVSPGVTEGGLAGEAPASDKLADSFKAGKATGVVDVFDLATGTHQGRLPYSAQNRGSVDYKTDSTGAGAEIDAQAAITKDLREQIWRSIEMALLKR
jgi:hypothetical protein